MAKEAAKTAPEVESSATKADKSNAGKPAKKNDKNKVSFGKKITRFFKELKSEIKKVVWPSKKQIRNNTIVVLVFMAIAAIFIWSADTIISFFMNLIFK